MDQVKCKESGLKEQYKAKLAKESIQSSNTSENIGQTSSTNLSKNSKEQYLKQFRDQNKLVSDFFNVISYLNQYTSYVLKIILIKIHSIFNN